MINDVSARTGFSLNNLMVILGSVFLLGPHCINVS